MDQRRFKEILKDLDNLESEIKELSRIEEQELATLQMYDKLMAKEDQEIEEYREKIARKREELIQLQVLRITSESDRTAE